MKRAVRKAFSPDEKLTPTQTCYLHQARIAYLVGRLEYDEAVTYFLILTYQPE